MGWMGPLLIGLGSVVFALVLLLVPALWPLKAERERRKYLEDCRRRRLAKHDDDTLNLRGRV